MGDYIFSTCPHCHTELELEEAQLGDRGKCKVCHTEYEIDLDCEYEGAILIAWWTMGPK